MRPYRRQLQLAFPRKAYGQRWKIETFISVVKQRFGGVVTAHSSAGRKARASSTGPLG
jgi:hypothetical protein